MELTLKYFSNPGTAAGTGNPNHEAGRSTGWFAIVAKKRSLCVMFN
jgi:hypothetical protein